MRKLLCLLSLFLPFPAQAWQGTVLSVADGDTVTVAVHGNPEMPVIIRLYGIDAPEKDQPGGQDARARMEELAPVGKALEVIPFDTDRYGRSVALLMDGKTCLNREMIDSGMAWTYTRYCKARFCRLWQSAQDKARNARKGIWKADNPTPPWNWRKDKKER